jgi:hypothetical protein
MPVLFTPMVTMKARSIAVNSGVNNRVSTGAMFSTTPCFASTSHPATIVAPTTPQGSSHWEMNSSGETPTASKVLNMNTISTPPPRAMRTM